MAKKLRCEVAGNDWVFAGSDVNYVEISIHSSEIGGITNVFLTPEDAKKLRKQIKKALAEIEPEEDIAEVKEEPSYIPHVGEVVEVYQNTTGHDFKIGEYVRVLTVDGRLVRAESLGGSAAWWIGGNIRPIQSWEPKEGDKVLIVDSTYIPSDTTLSWVGKFGYIRFDAGDGEYAVYNEDKSDYFGFHTSDLRPAE